MHLDLSAKRILVTGGAGFLGSYIVERLAREGAHEIAAPRRKDYDLTRADAVERLFGEYRPQVVIHAAATVGGIGANRGNPGRFFYENAIMGIQVVEACRRYGVEKTVVLGTICSYPKFTPVPFREEDLWEGYPEETNAPYGIAKKALLVQCQAYREQYGMNAVFLLPVNLYGPRDNFDPQSSHVIPALIRKCLEAVRRGAGEIVLWGDGSPTREFLYVEDAAEGIVLATERYNGAAPINLGSGVEVPIHELARRIAHVTRYTGRIQWDPRYPEGTTRRVLDVTRAQKEFGFRARRSLADGLVETVAWYRSTLDRRIAEPEKAALAQSV